jgi:hypothetical protein
VVGAGILDALENPNLAITVVCAAVSLRVFFENPRGENEDPSLMKVGCL